MYDSPFPEQFKKIFGHSLEDIIERDYRPLVVTEQTRKDVISLPLRHSIRDVRIAHGYFLTDEERRAKLDRLRKVELP